MSKGYFSTVFHHYDIAWRRIGESNWRFVKTPEYGWTADPFLVKFRGEIYLFAEIFLYKTERNGVIGYSRFDGNSFGEWTVTMDKHWHLSYPNVFVKDDKLYMIPESYQLGEVALYELIDFPDKWRKVKTILGDVEYCDSTFLSWKGEDYMFTFKRGKKSPEGEGLLYKLNENGYAEDMHFLTDRLDGARCGGKIIYEDGKAIRVAQNCEREYGGGLIFYEICDVWPNYSEKEIKRIDVEQFSDIDHKKYTGIHTYNRLDDIEVVDFRWGSRTLEEYIAHKRVHKVFVNKYR